MTDETLEQSTEQDPVLAAIAELSKKIDNIQSELSAFKKDTDNQFEAIRQGIVDNSVRFDRLDAQMFSMRADIANLKADMKELSEEVRHNRRS